MGGEATREKAYLERKIVTLEQRLVLVERFVEMRFCETFRDFSIRNLPDSTKNKQLASAGRRSKHVATTPEPDVSVSDVEYNHLSDNADPPNDSSSPPTQQHEQDDNQESLTSYRTRSGRKSKRLTATALGVVRSSGGKGSPTKSVPLSSDIKETSNRTGKILRVSVTRMVDTSSVNDKDDAETVEESEVNVSVVKIDKTGDQDEYDDEDCSGVYEATFEDDNGGDDGKYITFPTGIEKVDDGMVDGDAQNSDDGDWNASGGDENDDDDDDEDFEDTDVKASTSKKRKTSTTPKKGKSGKKRKSYHVPSRLDLLPEGIQLQMNPDNVQLRECPICHQHHKPETFDFHVQSHVKERNLQCAFCEKRFYRRQMLVQHQRIHQVDKYGRECRLCEKVFINSIKVLYHERICIRKHLEEEKSVDPAVMQDVREKSKNVELNWPDSNEKIPEGKKKCIHCKSLVNEEEFMNHLKESHANWKCSFCEKTFVGKSGLVRHLCRTHGNNCVTCEKCQKTFESRSELRGHNAKCQEEHKRKVAKAVTEKILKMKGKRNSNQEEKGGDDEESRMSTSEEAEAPQSPLVDNQEEVQISLGLVQQ